MVPALAGRKGQGRRLMDFAGNPDSRCFKGLIAELLII